jgi:2-polyprenyl-3-methyl-5-hydroxy-6-metoxy-1,4-benzoquinol methylase
MKLMIIPTYVRRLLERLIFVELFSSICTRYLSKYYNHLQWDQWHKGSPEWFDHRIDLYRWADHLNPHFVERGIYSREVMFPGCKVLDLASGDGFYPRFFYVSTGAFIDCIDVNSKAVCHSKKYHRHRNIRHFKLDAVGDDFPQSNYDVICFDGAIDHFTREQLDILLKKSREPWEAKVF